MRLAALVFAAAVVCAAQPTFAQEPIGGLDGIQRLLDEGAIDEAFVKATALVQERPDDVDVHVVFQDAGRAAGADKDLLKTYRAGAKATGADADDIYLCGRLLLGRAAQTEFRRALKLDPDHVRTLLALGDLYLDDAQIRDAEGVLTHAADVAPALAAPHLGLAQLARLNGDADALEASLRTAMEKEPMLLLPRIELGALLFQTERYDDARALLEETRDLHPEEALPAIALGQLERVMARDERAMREVRKREAAEAKAAAEAAAAADVARPAGAGAGAGADADAGGDEPKVDETPKTPEGRALAAFEVAAELDRFSVPALLLLAHSAIVIDEPIVARGALDVAGRLAPAHPDVRLFRAYLEIRGGALERAGKISEELLKAQRDLPEGLYVRGVVHERDGSAKKAEKDYAKAVRESDDDPLFHQALGALYCLQAKWKDAIKEYQTVVELTDSDPDALWDLARAQRWAAKPKEAAATLETMVALDPESLHGWLKLGQICHFELRKQERRAAQAYRQYMDLGGENEDVPYWLDECEQAAKDK